MLRRGHGKFHWVGLMWNAASDPVRLIWLIIFRQTQHTILFSPGNDPDLETPALKNASIDPNTTAGIIGVKRRTSHLS